MPAFEQHLVVVHVVAEGEAFVLPEAEFFLDEADGAALIGGRRRNIAPVEARDDGAQPREPLRQHFDAVFGGGDGVVDGDLAHGLFPDHGVQVFHLLAVGVREHRIAEEGHLVVFDIGIVRAAEHGVKVGERSYLVEGVFQAVVGDGVKIERFAAVLDERAVLAQKEHFVLDGGKELFEVGVLPPARGGEEDAAFMQLSDEPENFLGQLLFLVEQRAVEVGCDKPDHRAVVDRAKFAQKRTARVRGGPVQTRERMLISSTGTSGRERSSLKSASI